MRRIGRYILNGLTVLSLVLCVASAGLWVRSQQIMDKALWLPGAKSDRGYGFDSGIGVLTLRRLVLSRPITPDEAEAGYIHRPVTSFDRQNFEGWLERSTWWGFAWQTTGFTNQRFNLSGVWHEVSVPYWSVLLAAGVLPIVWSYRRLRRTRLIPGKCAKCGYDIRATPDRCPECGTIPTKVKA